jgi:hypothetical protein
VQGVRTNAKGESRRAWEETLGILEDPEAMASLRRGLRDAAAGRVFRRAADGRFVKVRRRRG